jgi:hypothetical protein
VSFFFFAGDVDGLPGVSSSEGDRFFFSRYGKIKVFNPSQTGTGGVCDVRKDIGR